MRTVWDRIQGNVKARRALIALIACWSISGAGIIAYSADTIYLSNERSLTASVTETLVSGTTASFMVSVADFSGGAVEGEDVDVFFLMGDSEERVFQGATKADGTVIAEFEVPEGNGTGKLLIKTPRGELKRSVKVLNKTEVETRIIVSTDKPLYQPGQTVHIRALVLGGQHGGALETNVTFEVKSPDGDKIHRSMLSTNEYGITDMDYPLASILPLGAYKIKVTAVGKSVERSIIVDKYVLPKFRIGFEGLKSWYEVDEQVPGTINATYTFGRAIDGTITLTATVYRGEWDQYYVRTALLVDGKLDFTVPSVEYAVGVPFYDDNGVIMLNATITDTSGHSESKSISLPISTKPIILSHVADTNVEGAESTYYLLAQYPDGVPVAGANVTFQLGGVSTSAVTDDRGLVQFTFTYDCQAHLGVTVRKDGRSVQEWVDLEAGDGIKVVPESGYYDLDETVHCRVFYSGRALSSWVYYDIVSKGITLETGRLQLDDGLGEFDFQVTKDMVGTTTIRVYKIEANGEVASDWYVVGVTPDGGMEVSISKDKDLYLPREDVLLQFDLSSAGEPVAGAIGVAIVDSSIFELSQRYGGLEDLFWDLEAEFAQPRFQILEYIYSDAPAPIPIGMDEGAAGEDADFKVLTTWDAQMELAEDAKEGAVSMYWTAIALLGLLGYVGLLGLGLVWKPGAVIAIALISFMAIGAGVLLASVQQMSMTSTQESGDFKDASEDAGQLSPSGGWNIFPSTTDRDSDGDASYAAEEPSPSPEGGDSDAARTVRSYFPETWAWRPFIIANETGQAFLNLTAPDTITTWEVSAIASTIDGKVGSATENVTVFKEFFIEPDVPVSVVRNDTFEMRVMLYNYANETRTADVALETASWFNITGPATASEELEPGEVSSVYFTIQAAKVGTHLVNLSAACGSDWDGVSREVRVVPDGKRFITLNNGDLRDNETESVYVTFPNGTIPGSGELYVKLQGSMQSVLIDGAESYIQFVHGCGEQSTSLLTMNVLAYRNLQLGDATTEQLLKYEVMLTQGIQHELIYLTSATGGYGRAICWHTGEPADIWLTAWAVKAFKDLRDAGFDVDEGIVSDMHTYLVSTQGASGAFEFPDVGHWSLSNELQNLPVAATSYVVHALVYSGYPSDSTAIDRAVAYIEGNIDPTSDSSYTLALSLLALELGGGSGSLRTEIAEELAGRAIVDDDQARWEYKEAGSYWYWRSTNDIETTGYAISALDAHGGFQTLVDNGASYLLSSRGNGVFGSTHSTAVAFRALNSLNTVKVESIDVSVLVDGVLVTDLTVDDGNSDITHYVDLGPYISGEVNVTLESSGAGTMAYQVVQSYHLPWSLAEIDSSGGLSLSVAYNTTQIQVGDTIKATATLHYDGLRGTLKMVLIDLKAPVGFSFQHWEFDSMVLSGRINQYEISDRQAVIYIDDVGYGDTVLVYHLRANKPISGTIQGVRAYDMYNPDLESETEPVQIVAVR